MKIIHCQRLPQVYKPMTSPNTAFPPMRSSVRPLFALILYLITEKHALFGLRSADCNQSKAVTFLCLEKLLGCFCSLLWLSIHLHCELQSYQFCSICLNLSREYRPATSIININKHHWHGSTGSHNTAHAHAITLLPLCLKDDVVCFRSQAVSFLLHNFLLKSLWYNPCVLFSDVFWQNLIGPSGSWVCIIGELLTLWKWRTVCVAQFPKQWIQNFYKTSMNNDYKPSVVVHGRKTMPLSQNLWS